MRKRRELLEYGPQFPDRYDPSHFSIHALVNTNWPMAVEYELESQATAVVTIEVMGSAPFTQTLNGGGMGERREVRFTLPVYKGRGPHPALITFKATRAGRYGDERASFRFLGAGAGEEAVAARSRERAGVEVAGLWPLLPGDPFARPPGGRPRARALSVYDVTLGPGQRNYVFSFRVSGKFNRWGADILKNVPKGRGQQAMTVSHAALAAEPIGPRWPVTGDWNGLDKRRRRVRHGAYWVRVMAAVSAENGGDWNVVSDSKRPLIIN